MLVVGVVGALVEASRVLIGCITETGSVGCSEEELEGDIES